MVYKQRMIPKGGIAMPEVDLFGAIIQSAVTDYRELKGVDNTEERKELITKRDQMRIERRELLYKNRIKNLPGIMSISARLVTIRDRLLIMTDNDQAYASAKRFIFSKNYLESWLNETGLDNHVDIIAVREFCNGI